jgi:hypothetical protein
MDQDEASSSRSTIAQCKRCGSDIGEFYNSCVKVTGSYYLPALVGSYRITGLAPFNVPKQASPESSLNGW